jgi:DNA processing protein
MDPRAEGTNDLIRQGATLCAAAEHVASALAPLIGREPFPGGAAEEPALRPYRDRQPPWDELDLDELPAAPDPLIRYDQALQAAAAEDADETSRAVIDYLGPAPVSVDDLARQFGQPIRAVRQALLELELAGRLERHGGNAVSLAPVR